MIESAYPGALDESAPEACDPTDHMDNTGAGKINDTGSEEEVVGVEGAGPAITRPEPVGNNRVDKSGEKRRIYKVGNELSPLGDGAAGDAGGGDGESPLVEEVAVVKGIGWNVLETEEVAADEAVGRGTEGEGEAEEVVEEAAGGGVEDVGEHDVHGVLGADGTGAEHGEAELHREDEVGGEQEVCVVHREGRVGELVVDGGQLVADEVGGGGCVGCIGAEVLGQLLWRASWKGHDWLWFGQKVLESLRGKIGRAHV